MFRRLFVLALERAVFFTKTLPVLFTVGVAASLGLDSALAGTAVKRGASQPNTAGGKLTEPQGAIWTKKPNPAPVQPAKKKLIEPLGRAQPKQTSPAPVQANIFWWPLRVGPNNDPNWAMGLSMEELYKELQRTMNRLEELGGPGIWNGCEEYNDWQRHRELLLEQLRMRQNRHR